MSEQELGARVVAWLRSAGWETFHEVEPVAQGPRADIVATRDGLVWIVECKVRLSWEVLAQAAAWEGWASYRSVATEHGPSGTAGLAAERALFAIGITWLRVEGGQVVGSVGSVVPQVARRAALVLDALRPEHQASRPGTASGEHYTATQERDARLREHVAAHPGVELRQACAALGLRLDADGRRALARHVRCALDGVTAQRDGRRLLLWPAERTGI